MALDTDRANLTRQYLLGVLPPEDAARLEEDFFADHEVFQEIEIAEDDLVDAYVRGELSENECRQLERNLGRLPRVAERIKFAKVLERATRIASQPTDAAGLDSANKLASVTEVAPKDDTSEPEHLFSVKRDGKKDYRGWKALFASWSVPQRIGALASAAVLVIAGSFLSLDWMRLRGETQRLIAERNELQRRNEAIASSTEDERRRLAFEKKNADAENETLKRQLEEARNSSQVGTALSPILLFLYPGGSRSPEDTESDLTLPARPTTVNLHLALEADNYPKYTVLIKRVGGPKVIERSGLRSSKDKSNIVLKLQLSSSLLRLGYYTVTVSGLRPPDEPVLVASYSFRTIGGAD